jgi:hypothetical protein
VHRWRGRAGAKFAIGFVKDSCKIAGHV